ncbi:MAG TPA: hypothetical protein VG841_05795 [Caulobacterales bacterium]|nr:hypothetical protein [Caulobacterales bacterium]
MKKTNTRLSGATAFSCVGGARVQVVAKNTPRGAGASYVANLKPDLRSDAHRSRSPLSLLRVLTVAVLAAVLWAVVAFAVELLT